MIFHTIQQFCELIRTCEFCNSPMEVRFCPNKTPNFYPKYEMGFGFDYVNDNTKIPDLMDYGETVKNNATKIEFSSEETPTELLFKYHLGESTGVVLRVDKITNKVIGDVDRSQKVIWDHDLSLFRCCPNEQCIEEGNRYIGETTRIVLERKSSRIYPFFLKMEILTTNFGDRSFALLTAHDSTRFKDTCLMSINDRKIVSQLPFMHLYKIKGRETIFNKIKTLVTFS